MADIMDYAKLGFFAGLVALALSFLGKIVPIVQLTFSTVNINVRQQIQAGVDTGFGTKVVQYLHGILPTSLTGVITVVVSAIAVAIIGGIIYENVIKYRPKRESFRIALVFLYGSVIVGLITGAMGLSQLGVGFLGSIIAMLIYFAIVGLILGWLESRFSIFKVTV